MAKAPTKSPAQDRSREEAIEAARTAFEAQDHVEGLTGTDSTLPEPPSDPDNPYMGEFADNPENPRGVPSHLTDGLPDSQATDSQKAQNPVPQRPPFAADMDPPFSIQERVSAGQNRKPPQEVIP